MKTIIAGAGIGGMVLGHALKRDGIDFEILESDPCIIPAGYRLHMLPFGGEALRQCLPGNLYELYLQVSRENPRRLAATRMDTDGNELSSQPHIDRQQDGEERPHTAINRLTLRELLYHGLEAHVRFGARIAGIDNAGEKPVVTLADGTSIAADILVAADGSGSIIRRTLLPEIGTDESRQAIIYARSPVGPGLDELIPEAMFDGIASIVEHGVVNAFGLWRPREPVAQAFARLAPQAKFTNVEPYMMVAFGLPQGLIHDGKPAAQLDRPALHRLMLERTAHWGPGPRGVIERIDPATCFIQTVRPLDEMTEWDCGRVAFLGDAIHATVPSAGAGAMMAMHDAQLLAEALRSIQQGAPVEPALRDYEARMRAFDGPLVSLSLRRQNHIAAGRAPA